MGEIAAVETAIEKFKNGDYKEAMQEFEDLYQAEPLNIRVRIYKLISQGLSETPVKGDTLSKIWKQILEVLNDTEDCELLEEVRQGMMVYANTVYCSCNDRQKMEYALLQKDVCFENKERLLKEFQRVLLAADVEYKAILAVVYDYAELAAERGEKQNVFSGFLEGALKSMVMAAELQAEVGLEDAFDPMKLAYCACRLHLQEGMTKEQEMRRELLNITLHGEKALEAWEQFEPYAEPEKKSELEMEVKKLRRREKLKSWVHFGKKNA